MGASTEQHQSWKNQVGQARVPWAFIGGFVLSLTAAAFGIAGGVVDLDAATTLLLTLTVAIVGGLVDLHRLQERGLEELNDRVDTVDKRFTRFQDVNIIWDRLERESEIDEKKLIKLNEHAVSVNGNLPQFAIDHAESVITELANDLESIAKGTIKLRGEHRQLLMERVGEAESQVKATSFPQIDQGLWANEDNSYLELQEAKIAEGVNVERIFVTASPQDEERARHVAAQQRRRGIETHIVQQSSLKPELRHDMVIIDDEYVVVSHPADTADDFPIACTELYIDENKVKGYVKTFAEIRGHAKRVDVTQPRSGGLVQLNNANASWSDFDARAYLERNYIPPRPEDLDILERLAAALSEAHEALGALEIVDVGTGPNLYPLLAALPWAARIEAWEPAPDNLAYLQHVAGQPSLDPVWKPFWQHLEDKDIAYQRIDPGASLAELLEIRRAGIFDLPGAHYDVVSMHFCAESITGVREEYERALDRFTSAVRPGGRVVASMMVDSRGYHAGEAWFPAVAVDAADVERSLAERGITELQVTPIDIVGGPIREGYEGMLFLTGKRRPDEERLSR